MRKSIAAMQVRDNGGQASALSPGSGCMTSTQDIARGTCKAGREEQEALSELEKRAPNGVCISGKAISRSKGSEVRMCRAGTSGRQSHHIWGVDLLLKQGQL